MCTISASLDLLTDGQYWNSNPFAYFNTLASGEMKECSVLRNKNVCIKISTNIDVEEMFQVNAIDYDKIRRRVLTAGDWNERRRGVWYSRFTFTNINTIADENVWTDRFAGGLRSRAGRPSSSKSIT